MAATLAYPGEATLPETRPLRIGDLPVESRRIICIDGSPVAGKRTLAQNLNRLINSAGQKSTIVDAHALVRSSLDRVTDAQHAGHIASELITEAVQRELPRIGGDLVVFGYPNTWYDFDLLDRGTVVIWLEVTREEADDRCEMNQLLERRKFLPDRYDDYERELQAARTDIRQTAMMGDIHLIEPDAYLESRTLARLVYAALPERG